MLRGKNGTLKSTNGAINATVTFDKLDIDSLSADLLAGRIGTGSAAVNQAMANLITIRGIAYPSIVPNSNFTFARFIIGAKPVRLNTQLEAALKDLEDGFTILQENEYQNQDVFGTSFDDVRGGESCSKLFFSSEGCAQTKKKLLIWKE